MLRTKIAQMYYYKLAFFPMSLRIVSWNVNGLRHAVDRQFLPFARELVGAATAAGEGVVFGLQETKGSAALCADSLSSLGATPYTWGSPVTGWQYVANPCPHKTWYSGTLLLFHPGGLEEALTVHGSPPTVHQETLEGEGRLQTVRIYVGDAGLTLVNTYCPNAGVGKPPLARLPFRQQWDEALADHLSLLPRPLVWMGDCNVIADPAKDLWNGSKRRVAGNTKEEREGLAHIVSTNSLVDVYRESDPVGREFTFYSLRSRGAREMGKGWRLDYLWVDQELWASQPTLRVQRYNVNDGEVVTSDHDPIGMAVGVL